MLTGRLLFEDGVCAFSHHVVDGLHDVQHFLQHAGKHELEGLGSEINTTLDRILLTRTYFFSDISIFIDVIQVESPVKLLLDRAPQEDRKAHDKILQRKHDSNIKQQDANIFCTPLSSCHHFCKDIMSAFN